MTLNVRGYGAWVRRPCAAKAAPRYAERATHKRGVPVSYLEVVISLDGVPEGCYMLLAELLFAQNLVLNVLPEVNLVRR